MEKGIDKIMKFIKDLIPYVVLIIAVLLFKKYIMSPIRVNGDSMNPTLKNGDIMILNIIGYRFNDIKRGDIVVVHQGNEYIIKRVIGLPGDTIEYKDHNLYINDKRKDDKFAEETADFVEKVPKGKYFVLGDNRNNSMDSRFFGAFKKKEIMGKADLFILPFNRFGEKE